MGVKGTRRARVRTRGEFRKSQAGRKGRSLEWSTKEGSNPKVEGETCSGRSRPSLAKGPFENDERKERKGWKKGVWRRKKMDQWCGLAFRGYIRPRDPNKPGHSNFLLAVREN